jgi:hypothetical protein
MHADLNFKLVRIIYTLRERKKMYVPIFANTSIIEYYCFFSDVEHFFPGIAPLVSILLFPKNIDDFSLLIQKKNLQQIQGIL